MLIYLLINNPNESMEKIKSNIEINDLKIPENKIIFEKIITTTELESDKIIQKIANIEDENIQKHISEVMVSDYNITSVDKCIEDLLLAYAKEKLQDRKMEILSILENSNSTKEEIASLEMELRDIIVKLAKIK